MCCGVPLDMYDVVVLGADPVAFATAFAAREAGRSVALIPSERPLDGRLAAAMSRFEITLIEGYPRREDEHYVDVEGRLVYGERVVSTLSAPGDGADHPSSLGAVLAAAIGEREAESATAARSGGRSR